CSPGRALDGALAVTVSPDGRSVYATGSVNDAVAAFDRGEDGTLAQKSGPAGCISGTGAGACADGSGLGGAGSVVVTPDGRSAYVGAVVPGALSVFDRRPAGSSLAPNATGPRLSGLKLSKKRFHAASVGPRIAFRGGVRVSYRLSKPAAVSFRVESARPGRRHGYRTLRGHLVRRGQAGRNATRFRGPLAGRRLPAGRYRLRAVATDADGNTSHPKHRRFRVVRR
ncbi:MAG: hypothetical protein H0V25_06110, partial [Solirubrobacterales bacterium]|nr:hypothetical protein [Solirubrobacterales bacterium]